MVDEHAPIQIQIATPVGWFRARVVGSALTSARFFTEGRSEGDGPVRDALDAYFAGDTAAIDVIETRAQGSAFQQRVWRALRRVPAGTTVSYGELAREVGVPGAARAVGRANATNPVGLVVPCHRIVRTDGTIGGYAGGVERKRWLLDHESRSNASAVTSP